MSSVVKKELETIQILRAIAATSVVYFHTFVEPHFGRFGVDIFFVISGFVMAMIVAGGQSTREFALQRLIRIVPLYWILTTMFVAVARIRPDLAPSTDPTLSDYVRSLFFVPYFKEDGTLCPILTVGWTLNYEMFFYACIWASMTIFRRAALWITLGLLITAYVLLGKISDGAVANALFGDEIVAEFLFGMILFELYFRGLMRGSAGILVLGAIAAYCFMAGTETRQPVMNRALTFGLPSAMLVYCVIGLQKALNVMPARITAILVGMGNASYATYLTHYFVIQSIRKLAIHRFNGSFNALWLGITIASVLTIGYGVNRFIDKPLNRLLRHKLRSSGLVSRPPEVLRPRVTP